MFDIFEIKKKTILALSQSLFETFENATNESIKELNSKLSNLESQFDTLNIEIGSNKDQDVYDEMSWNLDERYSIKSHLVALEEMKIVYLFKSLEIRMKSLIKIAYPDKDSKGSYKWDTMKLLFKNLGIDIVLLDGYPEAANLNTVNNAIKHSGEINNEIKKITEFKDSVELEFETLRIFYDKVKIKIEAFSKALGQAIINDLFLFDDKRLDSICVSYVDRMDKETAKKFIEIFNAKLNEKSEKAIVLDLIKSFQNY